jgi:hypothetical protein
MAAHDAGMRQRQNLDPADGWLEGEISVNTEEGSYDAEFRGMDMQELTA